MMFKAINFHLCNPGSVSRDLLTATGKMAFCSVKDSTIELAAVSCVYHDSRYNMQPLRQAVL